MRVRRRLLAASMALGVAVWAGAETATVPLRFTGEIFASEDLSAITVLGRYLVIGSDEGERIQLLEPAADDPDSFRTLGEPIRLLGADAELDIEALAQRDGTLYVLGSHSIKRLLLKDDAAYAANRARLATVSAEGARQHLFRLSIDPRTGVLTSPPRSIGLRPLLQRDTLLGPFTRIPDKENGLSLEGLAVDDDGALVVGFRSPVLREGFVPVLRLAFDAPSVYELRFVRLGGRGIRALARVSDGFLVLAAAEGDARAARLYWWDGADQIPGVGSPAGRVRLLAEILGPPGGVPEGLAVVAENERGYELIVLHDGVRGGSPQRRHVPKPRTAAGAEDARE